jgi:hypothetical protein
MTQQVLDVSRQTNPAIDVSPEKDDRPTGKMGETSKISKAK